MLESVDDVLEAANAIYGPENLPQRLGFLTIPRQLANGRSERDICKELKTTTARVREIAAAADPISASLSTTLAHAADDKLMIRARRGLGQMLLGTLAERAFEELYKEKMATTDLRLEDIREGGSDTDYRVYNGGGKPVFRINIKFHGTLFRRAKDLVGLETEDCFALATYKIHYANIKQQEEYLPYIFVIISVPGLKGEDVGALVPPKLAHFASLVLDSKGIPKKRSVEDRIVAHLVDELQPTEVQTAIEGYTQKVANAPWRVLSASKANQLLHKHLFDRVYALVVRGFTRNYPGAEVDMHFSISTDLTPLEEFLDVLKVHGLQGLSVRLDRGTI